MTNFNFNISSKQIDKMKDAFKSAEGKELDASKFTGDVKNIFDSLNAEYDNSFKNTGMKELLADIAGDDGVISEQELKEFMQTDGNSVLSMDDFITYANNAINEAIKEFDLDAGKDTKIQNYESGDVKVQVTQMNSKGEKESASQIREDGTRYDFTFNPDGTKKTQLETCPDGSKTAMEFIYDENGTKIGSKTTRYDDKGNITTVTESKYDAEGRRTYGKTVNADGKLIGEANYKYEKNDDGTTSQLRYDMSGRLTDTLVYKDNIKEPLTKTNHLTNTVENFSKDSSGKMTSSVKASNGNTLEENEYNDDGKVTFRTIYNKSGEKIAEIKYDYYDNGELKSESRKDFEVKTPVVETPSTNTNPKITPAAGEHSLGLSGEELADYAQAMLAKYGSSKNYCATGVSRTFEMAYGLSLHGNGCDWTGNMNNLVSQGAFREVTCDYPTSGDLSKLPAGAVITWDRTGIDTPAGQYGHVAIADGKGGEISDHYQYPLYKSVGGRSDTYHVYIPV